MCRHMCLSLAALLLATSVFAGGWSVATLEDWPLAPVAGQPLEITVAIRQHGRTLIGGLDVVAIALHEATGTEIKAISRQVETGVYKLQLVLPESGTWQWVVDGFGLHKMPALDVAAPGTWPVEAAPSPNPEDLFVAKGCQVCHDGRFGPTVAGIPVPKLTGPADYLGNRKFLRAWLADPQAVSPRAKMPDLGLSDDEIDVLVAWLSEPESKNDR